MKINNLIPPNTTLLGALKIMDDIKRKLLIISEDNKFIGVLSIGDIQRSIIKGVDLESLATGILRTIITVASSKDSDESIKERMLELRMECMPVLDESGYITKVIYWEDLFSGKGQHKSQINLPVVIMAGGKGTRLKPLTNVLPKPLIPIGNKTIIEEIINDFAGYGCQNFFISVNYKAELIQYYLDNLPPNNYQISYFKEDSPLGTAGSLHLLKDKIKDPFFVTNCDILVDQDYSEILEYHKANKNELTIVAALKHTSIPYGTIETGEDGILKSITEKPEITFLINTGLYILEPQLINEIPENQFFHITSLIEQLQAQSRRVGVFPVSEKSWRDIGEWKEYMKMVE